MGSTGSMLVQVRGFSGATAAPVVEASRTPVPITQKPADSQHAGITTPHGDHSPHHGGMVLMNGEMHYEVVFDPAGKHRVWFSNAVREDLPASIATGVVDGRHAADGRRRKRCAEDRRQRRELGGGTAPPLDESGTMVKLTYAVRGEPFEIEIPCDLRLDLLVEMDLELIPDSLIAQRIDRIEARRAPRRVVAEHDADRRGNPESRRQRRPPRSRSASRAPP